MPHTHIFKQPAAISLGYLLVRFSKWKCGTDEAHFKIKIYTGKYIYECVCISSTTVTEQLSAQQPYQGQQKGQNLALKTKIFTTYQDVHFSQPSDKI